MKTPEDEAKSILRARWKARLMDAPDIEKTMIREWIRDTDWAINSKPRVSEEYEFLVKKIKYERERRG